MSSQRDLLLVPFPFSDQSGRRVRPVVVISNDQFNERSEDLVVVGITSNISKDKYTINLSNKNLDEGKLFSRCCVKVENILKLDSELVVKKIGKVSKEIHEAIVSKFIEIVSYSEK